ncbi:DEAD/DEAH box RNA helicase, putative [Phytophthora infestans T30-4]|uniref:ATP-dependent RNA helicase n=1 Tax=Phytophthora infestans (strain T30-4) TaxID=403677 RepID=D0NJ74_PHYIT|nr:DEAD/DEAH box RNA helicase, putative [Phytophthora infestans T30-4]EEY59592.1 DEAD/DEAH box RNA helicase, putative [Phytophthora infestans T30-4]|eukprot:XP_002900785.1 DEAD/DEAH box RNA helicase, putative [Phytophthora infestans T30-4]
MSGLSVVPYTLAPATGAGSKPSKKRKKRSNSGANSADVDASSSMTNAGWEKVDIQDMQLEGFQDGCAFELEELTDYRVENTEDGGKMLNRGGKAKKEQELVEIVALKDVNLPKWNKFKLHPLLMQSLQTCGFSAPTRIQERTLLPALVDNRDVVGAAPTGSGKTLAFGLPILSQLLHEREQPGYIKDCKALILTPTRELAIQIQQHLEKMVRNREIGVVTLVGGMAVQKQKRILTYRPEIVIGTPGRLWDIIETNHEHMQDLATSLRFLVVDEADRMLQPGSYSELEKIFEVLRRKNKSAASELTNLSDSEEEESDEADNEDSDEDDGEDIDMSKFASGSKVMMLDDVLKMQRKQQQKSATAKETDKSVKTKVEVAASRHVRQTFLFSATLTIPEGGRFQKTKTKKYRNALSVLERVMKRVGLRGKPAVVDLSIAESDIGIPGAKPLMSEEAERKLKKQQQNVALSLPAGLELCQHEVTESTRDSFLYFFLTQYPGRTIIFLNAIHQVRKLSGLLTLLNLPVFALHAEMQQRQRLKKLDGFRSHSKGILVATDVAARGLDIPSVDYVVHYHIARSTEVFVHRSGRTARANKDGLSISLVSPTDAKYHTQICKMLQRPTGLSDFPFDHRYLEAIDERLRLAKSINEQENAAGKLKSEATWFQQMAAAADLDLDEDLLFELGAKQRNQDGKKKKTANQSVQSLRAQLSRLLAAPLRPVGSARKFRQLHKELGSQITGDGEYRARDANEDLASKGKKSYKRFRRRK